ncbi:enoyl-CoA hydratase/isomerase family protein [Sphingobium subterraneum]|uniref:Enoyl-CoA hydratase n=1 Tax=Sphingobium subterraneum TaxID=627688 RepID=A0A841J403_9SPHN|nr:enoyl-CoA hydratase/isomerase family protein [Sphingobium subterraneum]MBB6122981.1 enoyl-CoA hydratase [Sphingobium subterraneum]
MSHGYDGYKWLKFDRPGDGVLRITLDRPERLNALDHDGHRELAYIWNVVHQDDAVRAVILRGAGRAFSAGGDFSVVEDLIADHEARVRMFKEARDLVYNIINCSKPIVSAIHGAAVGAGLVAALLADIPVATKGAKIVDGHTKLGVAAGDHAAIIWPLLCGMAKAKYHLMLCEPMTGEMAEQMGLVALAVEDDELETKTLEIADKLAGGAQSAIRFTKYALNNWLRMAGPSFDASLALEMLGFSGAEAKEGLAAYQEKRPAEFPPHSAF